jgi:hypothetical protein
MLEGEHGITAQDVKAGRVEAARAQRFRNDDRLLKTLILSALAPEVEALHALTPSRLAALNHGTVRSPIPGQENQIVLQRCRNWAAQVGEIKIADDGPNPTISLHIVGVDTDGFLANAQSFDSYGTRIQNQRCVGAGRACGRTQTRPQGHAVNGSWAADQLGRGNSTPVSSSATSSYPTNTTEG